jgi:ComF family protein
MQDKWQSIVEQVQQRLRTWTASGARLLYPPNCLICGTESLGAAPVTTQGASARFNSDSADPTGRTLCVTCVRELAPHSTFLCRRCGAERAAPPFQPGDACAVCQDDEHRFDSVVALGPYRDLLRECVLRIKRPTHEILTRALAELLAASRRADFEALHLDAILPIPMHWWRRLRRGTNSAELLGTHLGDCLGVPLHRSSLYRQRATMPQGELAVTVRRENLRHALKLRPGCDYQGARLLVVDDILTTGVTCDEAARTLFNAGAASVHVAVLARAIPRSGS